MKLLDCSSCRKGFHCGKCLCCAPEEKVAAFVNSRRAKPEWWMVKRKAQEPMYFDFHDPDGQRFETVTHMNGNCRSKTVEEPVCPRRIAREILNVAAINKSITLERCDPPHNPRPFKKALGYTVYYRGF